MIPAAFDYIVPDSLEAAAASLADAGDNAKVMAGGHSLLPMMKLRLAQPGVVIDLKRLDSLRQIQVDGGALRIGALVTHHQVETSSEVNDNCALLAKVAGSIGDPQVRNRGTIGSTPSIVNAVVDALSPFGVTHIDMPLKPEKIWRLCQGGTK